jgi:hypothetical protein
MGVVDPGCRSRPAQGGSFAATATSFLEVVVLKPRRFLTFLAGLLVISGKLLAQSSTSTISGRVVDSSGAAMPGVEVRVVNQVDQTSRAFNTTTEGTFIFPNIDPGTYTISAKMQGFKQYEKKDVVITANQTFAAGDLRLDVGAVSETVEVVAQGEQVQSASAERSGILDSKQMMDLQARGRDVMALLQVMMPGVVNDNTGSDILGQYTTPTMDGTRANYNALNIDGISGNTARGINAQSPINMDAISEVTVLANSYTAEYGTAGGGVINLVTKTGTQHFHGAAYYYSRNEDFNANNYFNNAAGRNADGTMKQPRPRYRYNTEGFNLGGPIYIPGHFNKNRQKLFFFFSQEYDPNTSPNSIRSYVVPTTEQRQGDFNAVDGQSAHTIKDPLNNGTAFPNNIIPANRLDPNSSKLLGIFPLPNTFGAQATLCSCNFQISGSEQTPVKQEMLRVDYNATEKARLWFKASGFSSDNTGLTSAAINNQWGPAPVDYQQTMPFLGAHFDYVFSPTLVNELSLGMNLWTEDQLLSKSALANYQRATYGINIPQTYPADNPDGLLPAMSFGGITNAASITYDGRFPMVDDSTLLQLSDSTTKIYQNHTFKAGLLLAHRLYNQYHQAGGNSFPGSFAFATDSSNPLDSGYAYANALLGNYDTYTEATNRVNYAPITKNIEWYIQDHWRVGSHLTVDYGVRFTDAIPMEANNNNAGNFVPALYNPAQAPVLYRPAVVNGAKVIINPLTGVVVPNIYSGLIVPNTGTALNGISVPGNPGFPNFSNGILFAPRVGIAWDPFGDGKTAVRLGGGIYYAGIPDAGTLGNLFFNPPAIYTPTAYYGTVASAANTTGLLSPSSFSRDIDQHAKIVTTYHLQFEIQRQIGNSTLVRAGYVGSFGRHLGENVQLNSVPYGAEFLPQNQNPQTNTPLNDNYFRPFMGYGNVPMQIWEGNSSYHSFQAQVTRRYSHGIQYGFNYTFSKAMDYSEGDSTTSGGVAHYLNRAVWNYGLAGYDRPNIISFYFLWDIPKLSRVVPNGFVKAVFDGWQLSDMTSFVSGAPLAISISESPTVNFAGGGDGSRPLLVANPTLPSSQRSVLHWYNVAAFAEPIAMSPSACNAAGCPPVTIANIGDSPAMPIRGPGVNNFNTSLFKNFRMRERFNFQLRMEAYNTFNHTQFSGVGTSIQYNATGVNTTTAAGTITSARDPRYLQLALRLMF